jgi:phytoene dehydrogenase-like protein
LPDYDSIVIGAGHNSLVCAALLARAGQRVLVLEAGEVAGGMAATREFHPGFRTSVAHSIQHFSGQVAQELGLKKHGYAPGAPLDTLGLAADGNHVRIGTDSLAGVTDQDIGRYPEYLRLLSRCAAALAPFWGKTMPRIGNNSLRELLTFAHVGLKLRGLGKADMREFFRIASLPARDLMDEQFDSELLKACLSWDALVGSTQAPRSPNNTILTLLYRMSGENRGTHQLPGGAVEGLVNALLAAAETAGAELRCHSAVERVVLRGDENGLCATGVRLVDGSEISANRVISGADPKRTFFDLVGVQYLEIGFTNRINRLRCNGQVAKLHLALNGEPVFEGVEKASDRMIIAPTMDALEFAWDEAKYGGLPAQPVMEVMVPTLRVPEMAPTGQHVLSAHVMYVPYALAEGWTDEARNTLLERTLHTLTRYAPSLREQILHAELLTPEDLERGWRVTGGHWHHTELAMDQMLMMRPTYEAAQYSTPIPGLFLCGAGSHPGGGLAGYAGFNAAREILK